jgi:hypothetical protein
LQICHCRNGWFNLRINRLGAWAGRAEPTGSEERLEKRELALSAASNPDEADRKPGKSILNQDLSWNFAQHFSTRNAGGYLAQGSDGGFIFRFNSRSMALSKFTCAVSGSKSHFESVGDEIQTIINGNTSHVNPVTFEYF